MTHKIRQTTAGEFDIIHEIINDAASAYRGVIPDDRLNEPYMSTEELEREIRSGVRFWGYEAGGRIVGVMGIQDVGDVTLIRHSYVRTEERNRGIGTKLLARLREETDHPILIGTWADAVWAIRFYEKHGFQLVGTREKNRLLKKYWDIPERQVETSVVLADRRWFVYRK
jgi:GNAT superfamily N-acetyltransferase